MTDPAQQDAEIVEHINHGHYVRGTMPIHEQTQTFEKVFDVGMVRLGSLHVAVLVLFLTLNFCTPAGWGVALVVSFIVWALGFWFLRKQPTSDVTH